MNTRREFSLAYLSVVGSSPAEMIDVAAATGYDHVGLRLTKVTADETLPPLLTDDALVRRTRRHADEAGIGILDVELARVGPNDDPRDYASLMERAGELGARSALAQLPDHDRKRATYSFATLCELAAPSGVTVGLEFLPWGPTDDLAAAVEIVRGAAQENGGIVIDTLHFCRSTSTADQIRVLPPSMFPYVQLCDAPALHPVHRQRVDPHRARGEILSGRRRPRAPATGTGAPTSAVRARDPQRADARRPRHGRVRSPGARGVAPVPHPQ